MKKALMPLMLLLILGSSVRAEDKVIWKKHVVTEQGQCLTAVAIDANGDEFLDVLASINGKVSLFIASDWKREAVLFRFPGGGTGIHSAVIDVPTFLLQLACPANSQFLLKNGFLSQKPA
jgi:hypothetical protein